MARQLALPLGFAPGYAAEDYIADESNAVARAWLADPARWPGLRLAVHGAAGRGKTHLLHAWRRGAGACLADGPVLRAPLERHPIEPGRSTGKDARQNNQLEHFRAPFSAEHALAPRTRLAIDDADLAEPHALLHTLNAAAEAGVPVLLAAREPPGRWPVELPDLRSRLRAIIATELHEPTDALRAALLARLLSDRQIDMAQPLQSWLIARLPRDAAALREAVARLDRAQLAMGGRLTRGLLLRVVAGLEEEA